MSTLPILVPRGTLAALCLALLPSLAAAQEVFWERSATVTSAEPSSIESELRQRAEAQFELGDVAGALSTHGILESALNGTARSNARESLWQALNTLPADTDFSAVTEPIARGWVELMRLIRSGAPLSAFEEWRQRHPDHPGESQIAAGLVTAAAPVLNGNHIGLLLPLSGPLAAAAKAISAGADGAHVRAGPGAPPVMIYDTTGSLEAAVAGAQTHSASALIGPLRKEDVASYAASTPQRPTIGLNYLDSSRAAPAGFTPFGLAPEDEARAAADHATGRSLLRAVILAQEGDWGSRTAAAFKAAFEARGGTVLAQESFRPATVDFSAQLKRLLGINASEARAAQFATTGVKAESQPVPRGDLDVVFLAARGPQAKLIWPQMRYLRAGRMATYAPGVAADGGPRDLGRLNVCDAPWRTETTGQIAALRGELAAVNPRTADTQRLFALGYDAYELARRATAGALVRGEALPGLTGQLVLEADGAVHRKLDCTALYSAHDDGALDDPTP